MRDTNSMFEDILKVFTCKRLINIYGKSGTGKTTLALHTMGHLITKSIESDEYCIWIQASEAFPKRRLLILFENFPEKLHVLNSNLLITPKKKVCGSYRDLRETLEKFLINHPIIPPNIKYLVIDNISHHLRYEINKYDDFNERSFIINDFFNTQLFPLIMFCHREGIRLILVHEMTYNPKLDQTLKFLNGIYNRLDSLNIYLQDEILSKNKKMEITLEEHNWLLHYNIGNNGFIFKG